MIDTRMTAGELILAISDDDHVRARQLLEMIEPTDVGPLLVEFATGQLTLMRALAGDEWRRVLQLTLLDASVEGVDRGAAEGR